MFTEGKRLPEGALLLSFHGATPPALAPRARAATRKQPRQGARTSSCRLSRTDPRENSVAHHAFSIVWAVRNVYQTRDVRNVYQCHKHLMKHTMSMFMGPWKLWREVSTQLFMAE